MSGQSSETQRAIELGKERWTAPLPVVIAVCLCDSLRLLCALCGFRTCFNRKEREERAKKRKGIQVKSNKLHQREFAAALSDEPWLVISWLCPRFSNVQNDFDSSGQQSVLWRAKGNN
jgi:hypothetical protein